jgi:hypothetical protein
MPTPTPAKPKVMLSYRRTDSPFADKLVRYLQRTGFAPWVDRVYIQGGHRWRDELLKVLRDCDACVPVLSPKYFESEVCRMEIFVARSFGRPILPVMLKECFDELRNHEETKGLEDIFMVTIHNLSVMGLPIDGREAFRRVAAGIRGETGRHAAERPVYISYASRDGEFATKLARALEAKGVPTWVATLDVRVGENWRDAQVRAMMRAAAHLVVLSEDLLRRNVLRTEILLSEARGLDTYSIVPPRLSNMPRRVTTLVESLRNADETYRRLAAVQHFSCADGVGRAVGQLVGALKPAPDA